MSGLLEWAERRFEVVFLGPAIAVLVAMLLFPLASTVYFAAHEWFAAGGAPPRFVGFGNFLQMASDVRFFGGLARTFAYTLLAVGGEVVLGVALALLFQPEFPGRGLIRTLFLLPMMATPVAIALVWLLMYDPSLGVLNHLLSLIGFGPQLWVNDPDTVLMWLAVVDVWEWTPLVMLIVLGGLATLPAEPFEAARIDGAGRWQTFRYVTLPLLRPYIAVAALFRGIDALKTFDQIYVITGGGPAFASETLNIYIYQNAFNYMHIGYASAMLVAFFVVVMGLSLFLIHLRRGRW